MLYIKILRLGMYFCVLISIDHPLWNFQLNYERNAQITIHESQFIANLIPRVHFVLQNGAERRGGCQFLI